MADASIGSDAAATSISDLQKAAASADKALSSAEGAEAQRVKVGTEAAKNIQARDRRIETIASEMAERKFDKPAPHLDIEPFKQDLPEADPMKAFGSIASLFAIAASGLTGGGIRGSMDGAAAAINAARQNDLASFKANFDKWKANTDYAVKRASFENEQYRDAIELYNTDFSRAHAMMSTLAQLNEDEHMIAALKSPDPRTAIELVNARNSMAEKFADESIKLEQYADRHKNFLAAVDALPADKKTPENIMRMYNEAMVPQYGIAQLKAGEKLNAKTQEQFKALKDDFDKKDQDYRTLLTTQSPKSDAVKKAKEARDAAEQKWFDQINEIDSGSLGESGAAKPDSMLKQYKSGTKYELGDRVQMPNGRIVRVTGVENGEPVGEYEQ